MNRRNFVSKTFAAGVTTFIPVYLLEAISVQEKNLRFNDELMDQDDIIPAPDDPNTLGRVA